MGNACDVLEELIRRDIIPDIVTDQTSAHDELNGYIPCNLSLEKARELREKDPETYKKKSLETMAKHVAAMVECQRKGAVVFDYGNNIRAGALKGGFKEAFSFTSLLAIQLIIRDTTSVKLCNASLNNAKLPERIPPTTCAIVIAIFKRIEIKRLRPL